MRKLIYLPDSSFNRYQAYSEAAALGIDMQDANLNGLSWLDQFIYLAHTGW